MPQLAILDDYQDAAFSFADWSAVGERMEIVRFTDHEADFDRLVARLIHFEVITTVRERTPLPRRLIEALPNLKLIVTTGMFNRAIDLDACEERGIYVCGTSSPSDSTSELTWAIILALARKIVKTSHDMTAGKWGTTVGLDLNGLRLGLVGLGRIGGQVATVGKIFEMDVVAWSSNLSDARCHELGVKRVSREELFGTSDFISLHMVLSERTRGMIGASDFARMKPSSFFVNTSRGQLIDQDALLGALSCNSIAGAGLDVFDIEPLAPDHPLRSLENALLLPHIGYVTERQYKMYYEQTVENVLAFMDGRRLRPLGRPET